MGGNALSIPSCRLQKQDYFRLAKDILESLKEAFPNNRSMIIKPYATKSDFGDMDLLIENTRPFSSITAAEKLGAVEIVKNGPVTSLSVLNAGSRNSHSARSAD